MKATRLYLLRHGQVAGFEEKRYNGQTNVPLTETGRAQMDRLCQVLSAIPLEAVYSSDLERCVYGAARLGQEIGLPVTTDAALREMDCGQWQGRPGKASHTIFPRNGGPGFRISSITVCRVARAFMMLPSEFGRYCALFWKGTPDTKLPCLVMAVLTGLSFWML